MAKQEIIKRITTQSVVKSGCRFKCENCGWIGTQDEMLNEQDIDYSQDSCKECKQVMIDNRYSHIYCKPLTDAEVQELRDKAKRYAEKGNGYLEKHEIKKKLKRPKFVYYLPKNTTVEDVQKIFEANSELYKYIVALDDYIDYLEEEQSEQFCGVEDSSITISKQEYDALKRDSDDLRKVDYSM